MLRDFYNNEALRISVQEYLNDHLDELALKKLYSREDISGIADAKEAIESAFDNLEALYARTKKKKETDEAT